MRTGLAAPCHSVVLVVVACATLGAQAVPPPGAVVNGVVFDSLITRAPLPGAEVEVAGTTVAALSDSLGHFQLTGVPAGRQILTFYHPLLDSLSIGAGPVAVQVPERGEVQVRLATPAAERVYAGLCPGKHGTATGVIIGRIREVEHAGHLRGSLVMASWTVWNIGSTGLTRDQQRVVATSDSSGVYRLCGVPSDVPVVVRALADNHASGPVAFHLDARPFASRDITVSLSDTAALVMNYREAERIFDVLEHPDAPPGSSAIVGIVHTEDGQPLVDAQAAVLGSLAVTRTDGAGRFRLPALPAGSQTLEVRALGYAPTRVPRTLRMNGVDTVDVIVDRRIPVLAALNIVGHGAMFDGTGFERRRKGGAGYYITRDDIDRQHPLEIEELFRRVPGIRMVWNGRANVPLMSRGDLASNACTPLIVVDGYSGTQDIADLRPDVVRAIEVYPTSAAIPPMYRFGEATCGAILIWTRQLPRR